jgi:hypothetical protein
MMAPPSNEEPVTTIRILNVPSYTNEADFNNWFLFAQGFEVATLAPSRGPGSLQTGWVRFDSTEAAQWAIQHLDWRPLPHCPEETTLKAEMANKNFKSANPSKKRPHPDEDVYGGSASYSRPHGPGGYVVPPPRSLPSSSVYTNGSAGLTGGGATAASGQYRPSSTLFIGKLSPDVAEEDFSQLFGMCEGFERLKFVPPAEGKSGMVFAKFASSDYADKAIARVATYALPSDPSVPLQATFAKNDLDQPSTRGPVVPPAPPLPGYSTYDTQSALVSPMGSSSAGGSPPCDTMFIGNLAATTTEHELVSMLSMLSGYVRVKFVGESTQRPMAFVLFDSVNSCRAAISQLHGNGLPGAPNQALLCQFAKNSLDKPTPKYMRQGSL